MVIPHSTYWSWPSIDVLPIIERFRNPQFLTNDLYTNIGGTFSVRTYFALFIDFLSRYTGIESALILVYMAPITAGTAALALYAIARSFAFPQLLSVIAGVTPFAFSALQPALGLWSFSFHQAIPSALANMLIIAGIAVAFRGYSFAAIIFLLFATLAHPTTGILASVLVTAALRIRSISRPSWFHSIAMSLGIATITATIFFLLPMVFLDNKTPLLSSEEFYHVYIQIRHPHHYDLSSWPMNKIISFLEYIATLVILTASLRLQNAEGLFLKWAIVILGFSFSMVLGHIVFVNILHIRSAIVFTPVRLAPLGWPFYSMLFWASARNLGLKSPINLILILLISATIITMSALNLRVMLLISVLILLASAWMVEVKFLKKGDQTFRGVIEQLYKRTMNQKSSRILIAAVAIFVLVAWIAIGVNNFRKTIEEDRAWMHQNNAQWYRCIKDKVPEKEIIIVHPSFDSIAIRMKAGRAVYGDRVFPFNERYIALWWTQYRTVHGDTRLGEPGRRFDNLDEQTLRKIGRQSKVRFLILNKRYSTLKSLCENSTFTLVSLDE